MLDQFSEIRDLAIFIKLHCQFGILAHKVNARDITLRNLTSIKNWDSYEITMSLHMQNFNGN